MALNQPTCDSYDLDTIIEDNIGNLIGELEKLGFKGLQFSDFEYSFIDRCENLNIKSEKYYENCDIPGDFGVYRGYAGGGMHSGLSKTEIYNLPKNRQAKAEKALNLFETYFWRILEDIDSLTEANEGEPLQDWDRQTL